MRRASVGRSRAEPGPENSIAATKVGPGGLREAAQAVRKAIARAARGRGGASSKAGMVREAG
eukprot:8443435-Alexandrium_andersonii.AAC.1